MGGIEGIMPGNPASIGICSMGEVPRIFEKVIAGHLTGYLHLKSVSLPPLAIPTAAYASDRKQYDAALILRELEGRQPADCDKLIGVTAVDLFIPIFSHVFGEARQNGLAALVSTFRLAINSDGSVPEPAVVYERTAKVAIHEMGHLFNLVHCNDARCLMHFSGNLDELDRIDLFFCRYCNAFLNDRLRRD
jgi:archaemetzincin